MDLKEFGQYVYRNNVSQIEKFLVYVQDKIVDQKLTETQKRSLAIVYHRLWWYRDQEIEKRFAKSEKFNDYSPFIFPEYNLTAEQDIKTLLLANKDKKGNVSYAKLLKLFKTDISTTLDFFADKEPKNVGDEIISILYYDKYGNFWHGDKNKFCYSLGATSDRFLILKHLFENKGFQKTEDISDVMNGKDKQVIRTEIRKIKANIQKYLGLDDVLISKKESGYGINPKYKVVLDR